MDEAKRINYVRMSELPGTYAYIVRHSKFPGLNLGQVADELGAQRETISRIHLALRQSGIADGIDDSRYNTHGRYKHILDDKYCRTPSEELSFAIINQAVCDYICYLNEADRLTYGSSAWRSADKGIKECESFFRSKWFTFLTSVDGEYIIRLARELAKE